MMIVNPLAKRSARAPDLQVKGKKYAHKKAVTVFLARAAIRLLQILGVVTDNYRTQDACLIGLSRPYDTFGDLKKEFLHRLVTKAHPEATIIRFQSTKGDEFRCLLS